MDPIPAFIIALFGLGLIIGGLIVAFSHSYKEKIADKINWTINGVLTAAICAILIGLPILGGGGQELFFGIKPDNAYELLPTHQFGELRTYGDGNTKYAMNKKRREILADKKERDVYHDEGLKKRLFRDYIVYN